MFFLRQREKRLTPQHEATAQWEVQAPATQSAAPSLEKAPGQRAWPVNWADPVVGDGVRSPHEAPVRLAGVGMGRNESVTSPPQRSPPSLKLR